MMTITGAIVVYAMLWFLCLFCILPQRMQSQSDAGEVVPGTPASAPEAPKLKAKFIWTTIAATTLWAIAMAVIVSGAVSIDDLPVWHLPERAPVSAQ